MPEFKTITKEMTIKELFDLDMTIAPILMASGMECIGCPASAGESLAEACVVHGLDVDEMVERINTYLKGKAEYEEKERQSTERMVPPPTTRSES